MGVRSGRRLVCMDEAALQAATKGLSRPGRKGGRGKLGQLSMKFILIYMACLTSIARPRQYPIHNYGKFLQFQVFRTLREITLV